MTKVKPPSRRRKENSPINALSQMAQSPKILRALLVHISVPKCANTSVKNIHPSHSQP